MLTKKEYDYLMGLIDIDSTYCLDLERKNPVKVVEYNQLKKDIINLYNKGEFENK